MLTTTEAAEAAAMAPSTIKRWASFSDFHGYLTMERP